MTDAAPAAQTPAVRLAEHLGSRITPSLEILRRAADLAELQPPDPNALRQLRVASRRLRAFVRLFAPRIGAKRARRLNRRLRRITRELGPVRDRSATVELLEVALSSAASDLDRAALEHLLVEARHDEPALTAKAIRRIVRDGPAALADDVAEELQRVCGGVVLAAADVHAHVWPSVSQRMSALLADMPVRDPSGDIETLHELRIRAKRLRYTLELVRPLLGAHDRQTRRVAKKVQRTLGAFRDAALLEVLARERSHTLSAAGQRVLAEALQRQAASLAIARDDATTKAAGWLASFDPALLSERTAAAFDMPAPPVSTASPPTSRPGPPSMNAPHGAAEPAVPTQGTPTVADVRSGRSDGSRES